MVTTILMIPMILLSLLCPQELRSQSASVAAHVAPVDLPLRRFAGAIVAEAEVAGVPGRLLVSTATAPLLLTPAFRARLPKGTSESPTIVWGGVPLARADAFSGDLPPLYAGIDGVIGLDSLESVALGIDGDGRHLRVWSGGASPEEARAWIAAVQPEARTRTLALRPSGGGLVFSGAFGVHKALFSLNTTSSVTIETRRSLVPEEARKSFAATTLVQLSDGTSEDVDIVAAEGLRIGDSPVVWGIFQLSRTNEPLAFGADAGLSFDALPARRLVFDPAHRRLSFDAYTLDDAIARTLTRLADLPIELVGDRLKFVAPYNGATDALRTTLAGGELLEIAGMTGREIVDSLRAGARGGWTCSRASGRSVALDTEERCF